MSTESEIAAKYPSFSVTENADTDAGILRLVIQEDGRILHANPEFCVLLQTPLDKLKNQRVDTVLTLENAQDITKIEAGPYNVFIKGRPAPLVFQFDWFKTKQDLRYLIGSGHFEQKTDISVHSVSAFAPPFSRDFTSSDLKRFLDLSHQIMMITDDRGIILQTNAVFYDIFGYDAADLGTLRLCNLWENPSVLQEADSFEARSMTKRGEPRWIAWHRQVFDQKVYYTGHDITPLKQQQEALSDREKKLTQAESIGRMGHWRWVMGELNLEWSQEIYRIFGVGPDLFTPTLESMNQMIHRHDVTRLNQAFQRALIEENDYEMEFRLMRPDGEMRTIRCEGRCARDENGEVYALYGIMQDMTERILYESELKTAKEAAERAYAAKTQFLANMSHELRTPLNAIIGFSEMMERQLLGPIGTEKYLEYIGGIRESGEHLLDLISDILDMSKIEAGKYELDPEDIHLGKLIHLAAHMMEGRAHEAGVRITVDPALAENSGLKIMADRRAILQILLNLLSNAVKFTNAGGHVSIGCTEGERFLSFSVKDDGIGIPASKLNTITKPFEQVSASHVRGHEGSGLGLAITKELVEMHGGTLLIESTLGEGTNVTVRLPYTATAEEST